MMSSFKTFVRDLSLQILVLLVAGYLGTSFSAGISSLLGIQGVLWNNALTILLILIGAIIVIRQALVMKHVRQANRKAIYVIRRRPEVVTRRFAGIFYGVRWRILLGSEGILETPYVFVEPNPYCPHCDYETDRRTKTRLLALGVKHTWHCAQCNSDYSRHRDYPDESEVVEKRIEAGLRSGGVRLRRDESFEEIAA